MTVDRKTWLNRETQSLVTVKDIIQTCWISLTTQRVSVRDNGGIKVNKCLGFDNRITYIDNSLTLVSDVSGADAQPWTPAQISTVAWYDAQDANSITEIAGKVSQWDDKSGNNRHATQSEPTDQPIYQSSDIMLNNNPSIGNIGTTGAIGLDTPSMGAGNVYVVTYHKDGVDASFDVYSTLFSAEGNYGEYRVMGDISTPNFIGSSNFNDAGTFKNGSTTSSLNNVLSMSASLFKFKSSAIRTQVYSLGYNSLYNDRDWQGYYGEFIFTDGTEDLETQQKIEGYMAHRWGIDGSLPSGYPYKNQLPIIT